MFASYALYSMLLHILCLFLSLVSFTQASDSIEEDLDLSEPTRCECERSRACGRDAHSWRRMTDLALNFVQCVC